MDMKDRIRQIMDGLQMSQKDFAKRLGISPASLSSIFLGRTNPTNNHVQAVHRAFPDIDVSWLLFGEGEMYRPASGGADLFSGEAAASTESAGASVQTGLTDHPQPSLSASRELGESAVLDLQVQTPQESEKFIDKPAREIREIRIFFDDGTYETFLPSAH